MGNYFKQKQSKYKNKFTRVDGILFHSKKEAEWWLFLKKRQECGEISLLQRQVRFEIYRTKGGKPRYYIADFVFVEDGKERVVDVKSSYLAKTDKVFKIKMELFECRYTKNLEIWETSPPKCIAPMDTGLDASPVASPKTPKPSKGKSKNQSRKSPPPSSSEE